MGLLTRDQFREGVFERDGYKCIFCDEPAKDAHHIIERRLWPDGGYYLDNGASVCEQHHIDCEKTLLSVEDVREACGAKIVVPPHLYADHQYDKWGNLVLPNGTRLRGELFYDESVQKILKEVLHLFTDYVKYPRTHHLPWSPGVHSDDRVISTMDNFEGEVVVTVKMDGENTSLYNDYIHARSINYSRHESRDWVKNFWSKIAHDIPRAWRVCAENLYAKHSISYENLPSFLMGFSIWDDRNVCLSWDDTLEWFELLGIEPVPVLYRGPYDEEVIKALWSDSDWDSVEGYVIRPTRSFTYREFSTHVAKFVRENHVQTIKHWLHGQPVEPNTLKEKL